MPCSSSWRRVIFGCRREARGISPKERATDRAARNLRRLELRPRSPVHCRHTCRLLRQSYSLISFSQLPRVRLYVIPPAATLLIKPDLWRQIYWPIVLIDTLVSAAATIPTRLVRRKLAAMINARCTRQNEASPGGESGLEDLARVRPQSPNHSAPYQSIDQYLGPMESTFSFWLNHSGWLELCSVGEQH